MGRFVESCCGLFVAGLDSGLDLCDSDYGSVLAVEELCEEDSRCWLGHDLGQVVGKAGIGILEFCLLARRFYQEYSHN
jgi:hypothetical protein